MICSPESYNHRVAVRLAPLLLVLPWLILLMVKDRQKNMHGGEDEGDYRFKNAAIHWFKSSSFN